MDPLLPAQVALDGASVTVTGVGMVIVVIACPRHPPPSLTITVYVPAANPVNVPEAWKEAPLLMEYW
jgi:hypothetical protein